MPEDLIGTVSFLTSAAAAFVTGQTLNIDGGPSAELTRRARRRARGTGGMTIVGARPLRDTRYFALLPAFLRLAASALSRRIGRERGQTSARKCTSVPVRASSFRP